MILAQNPTQALLLMIFAMFCWGLWASMYKLTGKWRYELFYFDVAFGLALAVVVYSLTVGSMGFDGFSFLDDLLHAGQRKWLLAFGAGVIFNLANMIMMGAVVVAGLSVALALGLGGSLMAGLGLSLLLHNKANPLLLFVGTACLLLALVTIGVAYGLLILAQQDKLVKEGKAQTTSAVPGYGKGMIVSTNAPSSTKGLLLAIVAGSLMWIMTPLVNSAHAGDNGMGPYSLMALFGLGMFGSTFVFNLFFVNLPVEGEPIELLAYFQGSLRTHLIGMGAGVALCSGILAYFVAQTGSPEEGKPWFTPTGWYALRQGAVLVGALWGIFKLKDFRDAEPRVRAVVWMFILLFVAGLVSIGLAAGA